MSVLNATFCGNQFSPNFFGKSSHFERLFTFLNGSQALYIGDHE